MDTAVKILCDVAGADAASSDVIVDRSLPVLAEVMRRDEIEDKVNKAKYDPDIMTPFLNGPSVKSFLGNLSFWSCLFHDLEA